MIDHGRLARLHEHWIDLPGYPLEPDFPREEYELQFTDIFDQILAYAAGKPMNVVNPGARAQKR